MQDILIPGNIIFNQWRHQKITSETCVSELVRCRDPRALQMIQSVEGIMKRQRHMDLRDQILQVKTTLAAKLSNFTPHPTIDTWLEQYEEHNYMEKFWHQTLGLVGNSKIGKTQKAMSLFGPQSTLKVGCQGLAPGTLPSLVQFERATHRAIVFDECRPDQVLANREFFQAGPYEQALSESMCNQHMYHVWVYGTALILCANEFDCTEEGGVSKQDAEWLQANVVIVTLPDNQKWFRDAAAA